MKIKNILFGTFFSLILGLGIIACNDTYRIDVEKGQGSGEYSNESENVLLKFDLEGLKFGTPATRALSKKGENEIVVDNVRMLVFGQDNKFSYEAKITSLTPTNADESEGSLILLAKNTSPGEQNTFVLLTNVQSSSNPDVSAFAGKLKEEVLKLFTFNIADNSAWADGQLPMWGTLGPIEVNHSTGPVPNLGTIHLIRAVARVDVGLNLSKDIAGASQFDEIASGIPGIKLSNVFIYNTNKSGYVAPFADDPNIWDSTHRKAKAPSLQSSPAPVIIPEISKSSDIVEEKILLREIYLPEAINTPKTATQAANGETLPESDQANYMKRPYIVVGLIGADESNPTKETFFRIDYLKKVGEEATATYEYLPLLRNHRYLVNITSVGGPGFDNVEDAKKGPAANIMYNVVVWNESQMSNVKYDGQYMLGVSEDHFTFYREGGSLTAKVQTSWPDGFTVENLPDWITYTVAPADPSATGNTDEKIVTFNVTEHVTADRTYPVDPADAENALKAAYVQAGRIKWFLNFKQSKDLKVAIEIFSDPACTEHLEFININQFGEAYGAPDKVLVQNGHTLSKEEASAIVTFYVKTEPNIEPTFSTKNHDRFEIVKQENMGDGVWKYTVTAPDITDNTEPFDHIVSTYEFKITHTETGKSASTRLVLQQQEFNAIPFYDKELTESLFDTTEEYFYLMDGNVDYFYVKANSDYTIELISAPATPPATGDVLRPFTKVEENDPSFSGKPVDFTPVDDLTTPEKFEGHATFRVSSPQGLFPTRDFTVTLISAIIQPEANTYMVKAGARQGILIPASRVNTAAEYYDRLLNHDAGIQIDSEAPYPLPGHNVAPYRLGRLDDDDDWSVNIVWTDIHDESKSTPLEQAGLKVMRQAGGTGPNGYIFIKVGDQAGNVLIQLRSGKDRRAPLWSWHIWILDEYPEELEIEKTNVTDNGVKGPVYVMSHLIGAFEEPSKTDNYSEHLWRTFGMQYQWGRKDPFPAYDVRIESTFYDGDGIPFDFTVNAKGLPGKNPGGTEAIEAAGATYSMKASIENPASIVIHGSFWNYEFMPLNRVRFFHGKWVFRYPWNRFPETMDSDDVVDPYVGKTVFDPSPYGFRIMSLGEAQLLQTAYRRGPNDRKGLATPLPGTIYDGNYFDTRGGGDEVIFAIAQSRNQHAGCYLLNSTGGRSGWRPGYETGNTTNAFYRRALGFSIRPVRDSEYYGAENLTEKNYTKYLPK